jgi:hypothetical protein
MLIVKKSKQLSLCIIVFLILSVLNQAVGMETFDLNSVNMEEFDLNSELVGSELVWSELEEFNIDLNASLSPETKADEQSNPATTSYVPCQSLSDLSNSGAINSQETENTVTTPLTIKEPENNKKEINRFVKVRKLRSSKEASVLRKSISLEKLIEDKKKNKNKAGKSGKYSYKHRRDVGSSEKECEFKKKKCLNYDHYSPVSTSDEWDRYRPGTTKKNRRDSHEEDTEKRDHSSERHTSERHVSSYKYRKINDENKVEPQKINNMVDDFLTAAREKSNKTQKIPDNGTIGVAKLKSGVVPSIIAGEKFKTKKLKKKEVIKPIEILSLIRAYENWMYEKKVELAALNGQNPDQLKKENLEVPTTQLLPTNDGNDNCLYVYPTGVRRGDSQNFKWINPDLNKAIHKVNKNLPYQ